MRKKDRKGKAPNKTGAQRKGRGRQKPDKLGPNEVEIGAGRGAAKSNQGGEAGGGLTHERAKESSPEENPCQNDDALWRQTAVEVFAAPLAWRFNGSDCK